MKLPDGNSILTCLTFTRGLRYSDYSLPSKKLLAYNEQPSAEIDSRFCLPNHAQVGR